VTSEKEKIPPDKLSFFFGAGASVRKIRQSVCPKRRRIYLLSKILNVHAGMTL
jgi:hypothetical protein